MTWVSGEERNDLGVGRSGEVHEVVEGVDALLGGGAQQRHDPALGGGASGAAVAAGHLAVDHAGPDGLLGTPAGGVDVGVREEREQRVALPVEMSDELAVLV